MINFVDKKILAFDIEVVAYDFETHYDDLTKEYLLKYAETDAEKENIINNLVFNPFTSFVAAIGVLDVYENKGCVWVNADKKLNDSVSLSHEGVIARFGDEKNILEEFWKLIKGKNYDFFITFNGREFDCPYLMLRSFITEVRPSFNLMKGSDFTFSQYHIDMLKELTFYKHSPSGARRKFSLDFYCKQLGIQSPKADGISGEQVAELYADKEFQKIADYCIGDVYAEVELFKKWNETLNI